MSRSTLGYRGRRVGAVRQLIGRDAGHGRGRETPRDQVVKRHQLVGSRLLPPPRPPVAEPNLAGNSHAKNEMTVKLTQCRYM